jgi:hypothetical protein
MATLQPLICEPAEIKDTGALTREQAERVFEKMVQRYLKMSTSRFLENLDSGYFNKRPELQHRLDSVLFYLPLLKR